MERTYLSPPTAFRRWLGDALRPEGREEGDGHWYTMYPTRAVKGIVPLRIGAAGGLYVASPAGSLLVSLLEKPSVPGLEMIDARSVNQKKYMARYLIEQAVAPFIVGELGKASPVESFAISWHPARATWCSTGGNIAFNLEVVRRAYAAFSPFPWKVVGSALNCLDQLLAGESAATDVARKRLSKLLEDHDGLREVIEQNRAVKPRSGEYQLLMWALNE
jgi:hypothetical protein